jgi:hypothetical protein
MYPDLYRLSVYLLATSSLSLVYTTVVRLHLARLAWSTERTLAAYRLPSWLLTDCQPRLTHDLFLFCYTVLTL